MVIIKVLLAPAGNHLNRYGKNDESIPFVIREGFRMTISFFPLKRRSSISAVFAGVLVIILAVAAHAKGEFNARSYRGDDLSPTQKENALSHLSYRDGLRCRVVSIGGGPSANEFPDRGDNFSKPYEPMEPTFRKGSPVHTASATVTSSPIDAAGAKNIASLPNRVEEADRAGRTKALPTDSWRPFDLLPRPKNFAKDNEETTADDDPSPDPKAGNRFHWKRAIYESLIVQGFQHGYALVLQEKTRRALKGKFFDDYWRSVRSFEGWSDEGKVFTNYVAHPMQGAMTGYIFLQNHDRAKKQIFAESKQYWKDRFKAFVWSTAWSMNWEVGPISQSSIGNIGLYGKQGYVDLVITPTVGTGWLLSEEAIDRYIIRHLETKGKKTKYFLRTFLNPVRSVANMLRLREPWYRDRPYGH